MSKMYETKRLERELLYVLLNDRMILRRVIPKLRVEWMSDNSRAFILEHIQTAYVEFKSLIKQETLEYEVDKAFDDVHEINRIKDYKDEIQIVLNSQPEEKIDFIIARLEESQIADNVKSILENAYDSLNEGDIAQAVSCIKTGSVGLQTNKKDKQVIALHADSAQWIKQINDRRDYPEKYAGIPTGFKKFDELTGGLFAAELTIIFGLAGKGKSTIMKNIGVRVKDAGYNVLHIANEENEFQFQSKYHSLASGISYNKFKRGTFTDKEFDEWQDKNKNSIEAKGELYCREIPQNTDISVVESIYLELQQKGIRIDIIIIDYMDLMTSIATPYSEWDEQGKVTRDCKQLAIDCDIPILTCTQARQEAEKEELKDNPFLTAADMFGTKQKAHTANTLIGLVNKTATVGVAERDVNEQNLHKVVFCVCKNRDGPNFVFKQSVIPDIGLLMEDDSDENDELAKKSLEMANGVEKMEEKLDSVNDNALQKYGKQNSQTKKELSKIQLLMNEIKTKKKE